MLKIEYSKEITKEKLNNHKWLCKAKICLNTLKQLEKELNETYYWDLTSENIWKWEKQLKQCNKCYLDKKNHSALNSLTRNEISAQVHFYNSKNK